MILLVEPQWVDKGLHLDVSLEKVEIEAVSDLLSQVWLNLVANAIKFTPEQGAIRVDLHAADGLAVIRVSDTGIGISTPDQERIFERFYKADKSRNRAMGGSGLGLAIAKKIVDMHGGEIEVESRIGEGTTFTVRLPLHPEHAL
ncbi:sensor histidine kinase [Alicyclobacillus fastidiosus]|uniref:sensor histidine kinase n=1 Tax=Alicyclobacillus fastidiosus TaxID=392011 RepID=UPI002DD43AF1|nr:ATP-binding protein [Alicyclobacillus fastidiosus]